MNFKKKIFLFPLSLAVILFTSIIIIFSPVGQKNIVDISEYQPLVISSPDFSQPLSSPLIITGKVDPSWVFEASFPLELFDDQGKSLFSGTASAPNWTKTDADFIDFTAEIIFSTSATSGSLEFRKDNPSGLPENNQSFKIPVIFNSPSTKSPSNFKVSSTEAIEKVSKLPEVVTESKCLDYPGSKAVIRVAFEPNDKSSNYQIYFEESHPNDVKLLAIFFVDANTGLITTHDNNKTISYQQWQQSHQIKGCNFKPLLCDDDNLECPQGYACSISEGTCFLI